MKLLGTLFVCFVAAWLWLADVDTAFECMFAGSRRSTAQVLVDKYANQGFIKWQMDSDRECPTSLFELSPHVGKTLPTDVWHNFLRMTCGADAPEAANGFGVYSAGFDGRFGTCDDIKSWEHDVDRKPCPPTSAPSSKTGSCPCCSTPRTACLWRILASSIQTQTRIWDRTRYELFRR